MGSLFDFIFKTSAYAAVVGVFVLIIRDVLKVRLSAKWQYLIWIVLILKLLVPFGPKSAISLFNVIPQVPQKSISQENYNVEQNIQTSIGPEIPEMHKIPSAPQLKTDGDKDFMVDFAPYIWAAGAGAMLLWLILSFSILYIKLQKGTVLADKRLYDILEDCKEKMGIGSHMSLVLQNIVGTPSLFSIIRPKILLPQDALNLSQRELEYILLHELSHYRRHDIIVNYLLLLLQTIHWFNPVIWYCFRCMRQDMELATDERVLSVLENHEHKAYGKTLLAVLEGFTTPKLTPRLLGMVDDKKNIVRRINMIAFFKKPKLMWSVLAAVIIVIVGSVCLTNAADRRAGSSQSQHEYEAEKLYKYKNPYIGDAVNVGKLTSELPLAEYRKGMSLKTSSKPYGLTVNYVLPQEKFSQNGLPLLNDDFKYNAAIIFSLIDNAEDINFIIDAGIYSHNYSFNRKTVDKEFGVDVREYSKDIEIFEKFLNDFALYSAKSSSAKVSQPELQGPLDLNEAVSLAVKSRCSMYHEGEFAAEGHIILDTEEKNGEVKVYTIASAGIFGFENGVFTKISGSGAISTVIRFSKNQKGEYSLIEYKETRDGSENLKSKKEMFPMRLWDQVLSESKYYPDLLKQQEEQAAAYLKSIGKDAKVNGDHVDRELLKINVEASNKLFGEFTKYDPVLNKFPYWLGTREDIENGTRYIYETSQSKTEDGFDLVVFKKIKENGSIVKEYRYKIVGSEPILLD